MIDSAAIAESARGFGRWRRATVIVTGMRPNPTPCIARATTNSVNPWDTAARTEPNRTTARLERITSRRRRPSPRRPMIGVASAPLNSAMVSNHCTRGSSEDTVVMGDRR